MLLLYYIILSVPDLSMIFSISHYYVTVTITTVTIICDIILNPNSNYKIKK